jgi:hypothetical protein
MRIIILIVSFFKIEDRGLLSTLKVFDITGKESTILLNEALNSNTYEVTFDDSDLPGELYLYKLETDNFNKTKKMILTK